MIIDDKVIFEKVEKKVSRFFNLDNYVDYLFLSLEESIQKTGGYGFSFSNYYCIRFENEPTILPEISKLLPDGDYYLITLAETGRIVYKKDKAGLFIFLEEATILDFIILEYRMTWLLVYDSHRNLTGLGSFIRRKMEKSINTRLGDTKIMFITSDK